jgi:SAM-dependent methyltransferase
MDAASLNVMASFMKNHLPDKELHILDIGSQVVRGQERLGSYRDLIKNPKWTYLGIDISAGSNVDIVVDGYKFPFEDETFDVVISGQTMEHMEFPWVWFVEMTRLLKKGGICCMIAPAVFHEHKYPIDTYRYYPDGMRALAKWAGLTPVEIGMVNSRKLERHTYMYATKI